MCTVGGQSFSAGTKVVGASGALIAISKLKVGEKVKATNVKTGKTTKETVSAVLVHHDTNRYDLRVKTAHGTAVINTTRNHLFWDVTTRSWVRAGALKYGSHLRTPSGGPATVLGGNNPGDRSGWMWDLTVTRDHDFYVATGSTAVLVHNCSVALQKANVALRGWASRSYQIGEDGQAFSLDKNAMIHILTRHAPEFWDGTVKATQSFFDSGMSVGDITDAVGSVVRQNRAALAEIGTNDVGQVTGDVGGQTYTLGVNFGRIGQFFPGGG